MLQELPQPQQPSWLSDIPDRLGDLPLHDLLEGSVYYPACGIDGDPVKYLGGNFYSFVYVDYGVGSERLANETETFRGYRVLAARPVSMQELAPHGWTPRFPAGSVTRRTPPPDWLMPPFATWLIYERLHDFPANHGPDRFSLLYIGGDGVATFQALYFATETTPAAIAVIQPGTGFGGNWTNFNDRNEILAWSILDAFPQRRPRWLLHGGHQETSGSQNPCWPEFSNLVRFLRPGLRLWERPAE